jgi:hypothetical protein
MTKIRSRAVFRNAIVAGIVALVSTAAMAAPANAASATRTSSAKAAAPAAVSYYTLKSRAANVCLGSNGTYVTVNTCSSSSTAQRWQKGTINGWSVWINVSYRKAMTASGTNLVLSTTVGNRNQGFVYDSRESIVYWQGVDTLVLEQASTSSGAHVYLLSESGIGNQKWALTAH